VQPERVPRDEEARFTGAVILRARELVCFARQHGYRLDELVRIIEDVG
jgi:hypothetical protein